MEINFETTLKVIQSDSLSNVNEIKTFLKAGGFEENSFKLNQLHQKTIEVLAGGSISPIDIFNFFDITDLSEVSLVHIQIYNTKPENYNMNDMNFSLTIGGVDMGDFSQFTLANVKNFTSDIQVTGLTVPVLPNCPYRKAILLIMVGSNV